MNRPNVQPCYAGETPVGPDPGYGGSAAHPDAGDAIPVQVDRFESVSASFEEIC